MGKGFLRIDVEAPNSDLADRVTAEVVEAGASGLEETIVPRPSQVPAEGSSGGSATAIHLCIYVPSGRREAVERAVRRFAAEGVHVGAVGDVPELDWSARAREWSRPVCIGGRLQIRPSWVEPSHSAGLAELVIDPGQAFGTGGHASTRLALELLVAEEAALRGEPLLDVGCGSGVLAMAALRLGASRAIACDLDPLACLATQENARQNQLAGRVHVFRGSVAALASRVPPFIVANLLRSELLPLLPGLGERLIPGGRLALAGLLEAERGEVVSACETLGLRVLELRRETDASGEVWIGLLLAR